MIKSFTATKRLCTSSCVDQARQWQRSFPSQGLLPGVKPNTCRTTRLVIVVDLLCSPFETSSLVSGTAQSITAGAEPRLMPQTQCKLSMLCHLSVYQVQPWQHVLFRPTPGLLLYMGNNWQCSSCRVPAFSTQWYHISTGTISRHVPADTIWDSHQYSINAF